MHFAPTNVALDAKNDLAASNGPSDLLEKYATQMGELLKSVGGLESNLPLYSEYFKIRAKYQYIVSLGKG